MPTVPEDVNFCWCGGYAVPYGGDENIYSCLESVLHDPQADGRPVEIRRLYIAGPMSGYQEANYPAFNVAAERLREVGFEVVNPVDVHIDGRHHYVDLLREDLRMMLNCHGVAVLENWWESPGARNEVMVAGILKMPVRSFSEWLYFSRK
jgi:hypothetical protein